MRAFIGIDFNDEIKNEILAIQDKLKPHIDSGRWKSFDDLHLTLKFMGEIGSGPLEPINDAMKAVAKQVQPFTLSLADFWTYDDKDLMRFLWLGLAGDLDALRNLQAAVDKALEPLGYPAEKRGFAPHVTLGQDLVFQTDFEQVKTALGPVQLKDMTVHWLVLFASEETEGRRVYRKIAEYPLANNP